MQCVIQPRKVLSTPVAETVDVVARNGYFVVEATVAKSGNKVADSGDKVAVFGNRCGQALSRNGTVA